MSVYFWNLGHFNIEYDVQEETTIGTAELLSYVFSNNEWKFT